ncbi:MULTISPECIES: phage terminase small subunit [unclassified Arsenophonus]|uniref:phage terminase small subunit n=1 Tax=unclassified Arsenophonus TaxID=2627083 RepID=UPI0028674605|nr:phage terminase small subunit [Arsenophonus sp.]MDR5610887.1 phage terminase small subunit [Arsenophonus sp.]MDR5614701.1 phage terminase small subunit [Arsenophonus sp.]
MLTPWQCHQLRLAGEKPDDAHPLWDTARQQVQWMFQQDKRQLKRIQSTERKAEYKKAVLPRYAPWVNGVLENGDGHQDDTLMMVMLWRIDAGDIGGALAIAEYALAHRLLMPAGHTRTTGCAIAEEIAAAAKTAYQQKVPLSLSLLAQTVTLTDEEDMPDVVRAELYKWVGFCQRDNGLIAAALDTLKRALMLFQGVGVKGEIKKLEKALNTALPKT